MSSYPWKFTSVLSSLSFYQELIVYFLSNTFLSSCSDDHIVLPFKDINRRITLVNFQVKLHRHSWDKPYCSWCIFFILLDWVAKFFRNVYIYDNKGYFISSFLVIIFLLGFGSGSLSYKLGNVPFSIFLENLLQNWYYILLKCLVEFSSEAVWSGIFVTGRFLTSSLIPLRAIQMTCFFLNELY